VTDSARSETERVSPIVGLNGGDLELTGSSPQSPVGHFQIPHSDLDSDGRTTSGFRIGHQRACAASTSPRLAMFCSTNSVAIHLDGAFAAVKPAYRA
jgi:hypothetical protein